MYNGVKISAWGFDRYLINGAISTLNTAHVLALFKISLTFSGTSLHVNQHLNRLPSIKRKTIKLLR